MPANEMYSLVNANPWHALIPLYIFFKGLSAGALIISALYSVFRIKRFKTLAFPAAITALAAFIPVPLLLLADLSQPLRFWRLFLTFNPTSAISWGTWFIVIYPICLIWYIVKLGLSEGISLPGFHAAKEVASTAMGKGGIGLSGISFLTLFFALLADLYTAVLLGVVKGNALWNSALLPGYFLISALVTGAALCLIIHLYLPKPEDKIVAALARIIQGALAIEIFFVLAQWFVLGSSGLQGERILELLWRDPLYLIGDLGLGVLLPLIMLRRPVLTQRKWLVLGGLLVILGGLLLRFSIVGTGIQAFALWY